MSAKTEQGINSSIESSTVETIDIENTDSSHEAENAEQKVEQQSETPLPNSEASWRELLSKIPSRDLFRIVQKNPRLSAALFAGFRPNITLLKNPVVISRLVEGALKHRLFAEELASLVPAKPAEDATTPQPADTTQTVVAPTSPSTSALPNSAPTPNHHEGSSENHAFKEMLKKQKAVVKERDSKIQELTAQIHTLQRERDAARADAETARANIRAAKEEVERERRLRERAERRLEQEVREAKQKEVSHKETTPAKTFTPITISPIIAPFSEALQRLVNRGRYALVLEVCREALATESATNHSASRGKVHSLLGAALYGLGDVSGGEDQDRLAAEAFLDGGQLEAAAESLARLFLQSAYFTSSSPVRPADGATLRRLLLLAEREQQTVPVQMVFQRMRIRSVEAGRRLQATLLQGGKRNEALTQVALGTPSEVKTVIGADEPLALPINNSAASSVTARQIAKAVDAGDAGFIAQVRRGLNALRQRGDGVLADALLEAITLIDPVTVSPLLQSTSNPIIVDASNVARHNPDPLSIEPTSRVLHLILMRNFLLRQGFFPILMFADANLRFHVDDRSTYETYLERQIVRETSPGTSADEVLLKEALARRAPLVSNDRFSDWGEIVEEIDRHSFFITNGRVALAP
jgi:outer membrane murein-binding lipoprotein Lpp